MLSRGKYSRCLAFHCLSVSPCAALQPNNQEAENILTDVLTLKVGVAKFVWRH
jgi:hypothetical protein